MTIVTVRHITTYRYKQPVSFGEHRMMLRPRESHDHGYTHKQERPNSVEQEKSGQRHLGDASHCSEIVVSPGKNLANSNDQGPALANTVSVWRTQKSGDKEILQSNPRMRRP